MGQVIHMRRPSWVTRLWWALWRYMRPPTDWRSREPVQAVRQQRRLQTLPAAGPVPPDMASEMLVSQRRMVDELRRLNQILVRANDCLGRAPRPSAEASKAVVRSLFGKRPAGK